MKREKVSGVGVALTLAALSFGWQGCAKKKTEAPPPPPPAVVVAPVVQADVPVIREWIGTTEGNVNAEIRPKVDGYLLRRVYAEGSLVHQGDLLFTIDPRQTQAQLEQAQADLAQAEAQLAKTHQDVERFRPLAAGKAISQQELDNALSAERAAKAAADARRAAVNQARLSQGWARVTSPIGGIAGVAQQQVGDLVSPATVLTTVSQCDPIRVTYQLSEQEYLAFRRRVQQKPDAAQEDNLEMTLADGSVFPHKGRVLFEGRQVEIKTGTIAVVAVFPNPGNLLRPGQYAKVRGVTEIKKGALVVPQRAVNDLQGGSQVAVVGSDNKAEIRTVQTGERFGSQWVIESGLHPGDRVVVEGFTRVKSGVTVNPTEAPPEEPAAAPAPTKPAAGK